MNLAFILLCIAIIVLAAPQVRSPYGYVPMIFAVIALLLVTTGLRLH
jgi:hypothetical protein